MKSNWVKHTDKIKYFVLIYCALLIGMLSFINHQANHFATDYRNLLFALSDIEANLSQAHLWLSETLSGDISEKEKIQHNIDHAINDINVLINGGEILSIPFSYFEGDEKITQQLFGIRSDILTFMQKTHKILDNASAHRIGDATDVTFDKHADETIQKINLLIHHVTNTFNSEYKLQARYEIASYIILGLFSILLAFVIDKIVQALRFYLENATKNKKYYQTIFNASEDAIFLINEQNVIDANRAAIATFGFKKKHELLEFATQRYIHDKSQNNAISDLIRKASIEGSSYAEETLLRGDGSTFIGSVALFSFNIESSSYLYVIVRDITEMVKDQNMILSHARSIAMGEMLSAIAHQLKQPLSNISLSSGMLLLDREERCLDEGNQSTFLESIQKNATYMTQTIETFQNYLKPAKEGGVFSLSEALKTSAKFLEHSFKKSGIILEVVIEEECSVYGRMNELQQVFVNLFKNAKEAFDQISDENKKASACIKRAGEMIEVTIRDNAGGIPKEILENLFTPYVTSKGADGTGIGLYISKKIVQERFKGDITVSNGEEGAAFTIILMRSNDTSE